MRYRMKTVEQLTGLSRNTITAWERRYALLHPERDASGYRVYTDADVALLQRIRGLKASGWALRDAIAEARRGGRPRPPDPSGLADLAARLYDALLRLDRAAADAAHGQLRGASHRSLLHEVYLPLLQRVGDDWEAGAASVAQEHFVAAFCREHLVAMLGALEQGPTSGPVALCAGIPGEDHELPLLAVAIELAMRGFRVVYLGPDLPLPDLQAAVDRVQPAVICQSAQTSPPLGVDVPRWAAAVREAVGDGPWLAIGGGAVAPTQTADPRLLLCPTFPDLLRAWEERGALPGPG